MRVLREPKSPQYGGRFTCKKCGALLAYEKKDIKHHRHDVDGEYVECPFCGTEEDVSPGDGH